MPERMKLKTRAEFDQLYAEQLHGGALYDFKEELIAYYESDV